MNSLSIVTWILALCVWGAPPDRTESPFPLHDAIAKGDLDGMKSVLARGVDVNRTNDQGQTPLQCALKSKRSDFVQALLEHKADPNTVTTRERPPLIIAAETGDVESLKLLIKFGALIRVHDFDGHTAGHMALRHNKQAQQSLALLLSADPQLALERGWLDYTLIHQAVSDNRVWAIAMLAQLGTPIDVPNSNGQTAIYLAATNGQLDCVKVLLANKADPNGAMGVYVPLLSACERGHIDIAKLLIGAGGNLNPQRPPNMLVSNHNLLVAATQSGNVELVAYLVEKGAPKPAPDQWRQAAAASGKPGMIEAINRHTGNADAESPRVADAEVLAAAANRKSTDALKLLLKNGGNPNAVDQRGMTALMIAVDDGKPEHVEMLLAAGADVSAIDIYGRMALHIAAQRNNIDVATPLLAAGAPIEATDKHGQTPLACAARRSPNAVAVRSLLKAGANPNVRDHDGSTPLINSANINESDLVELLLQHGADPNATNKQGNSAIFHAVSRNAQSVQALIQAGAKLDVVTKDGSTLLHMAARHSRADVVELLLKNGLDINSTDRYGNSPIHSAAPAADPDVLRHLIEHGANVNARTSNGTTPLMIAASGIYPTNAMLDVLIERGADLHARTPDGWTAIHAAAQSGRADRLRMLVSKTDINLCGFRPDIDQTAKTPLMLACACGSFESARFLLELGADANAANADGSTALMFAVRHESTELVRALISAGANVNAKNSDGGNALMFAAGFGTFEGIRLLIESGAEINAADGSNETALYAAVRHGNQTANIETLCKAGADPNIKSKEGRTPLAYLCNNTGSRPVESPASNAAASARHLIAAGANPNELADEHFPILHAAIRPGEADLVRVLLEAGADPNVHGFEGMTALMRAVSVDVEIVRALIKAGAELDARTENNLNALMFSPGKASLETILALKDAGLDLNATTKDGNTALILAAQSDDRLPLLANLIKAGADGDRPNDFGETALMYAVRRRKLAQARALVEANANINAQSATGRTALHYAASEGNVECLELLLQSGARLEARDQKGETPLIAALRNDQNLEYLIKSGADVNTADEKGRTVLMNAAARQNLAMVRMLVQAGADPLLTDEGGKTALDWATQPPNGNPRSEVAEYLKAQRSGV